MAGLLISWTLLPKYELHDLMFTAFQIWADPGFNTVMKLQRQLQNIKHERGLLNILQYRSPRKICSYVI